jgi:hypothetical protein
MHGRALLLLPLLLAACDEPPREARRDATAAPAAAPGAAAPQQAEALRAAEERLRARLNRDGYLQRAVVVHRQALPGQFAVCGQVNPTGRADDAFIPYVALVAFEGAQPARVEFHYAGTTVEATRVYFEMVDRCFDGGGPPTARPISRPRPPAPGELPRARPEETRAAPAAALPEVPTPRAEIPGAQAIEGMALTRGPANIRAHPGGGGQVVRVAPRGAILQVFAEAPGGWVQVGEHEPWGWVHRSMLEWSR